jgi:hypothetical protein
MHRIRMQKLKNTSKHGKKLITCSMNYLIQKECINQELCIHMMVQPIIVGPTSCTYIVSRSWTAGGKGSNIYTVVAKLPQEAAIDLGTYFVQNSKNALLPFFSITF